MAGFTNLVLTISIFFFLCFASSLSTVDGLGGGKLGGRTEIKDAQTNKEVQELGMFSVTEYNSKGSNLKFLKVVKAEKQVVAGIKYYLKISAVDNGSKKGVMKMFDAVVVVQEWKNPSKVLVSFDPSTTK